MFLALIKSWISVLLDILAATAAGTAAVVVVVAEAAVVFFLAISSKLSFLGS